MLRCEHRTDAAAPLSRSVASVSTNERFKLKISHGQTGLNVAFDLPTQMGYDSDNELAEGEVGRVGIEPTT